MITMRWRNKTLSFPADATHFWLAVDVLYQTINADETIIVDASPTNDLVTEVFV